MTGSPGPRINRASRIVAGVLAVVWIAMGLASIGIGVVQQRWAGVLVGIAGVFFGGVWANVARTGPYAVWPFTRRRRDS
jgi:hypothetical protein